MAKQKQNVFEKESSILQHTKLVLEDTAISLPALQAQYAQLIEDYETLLEDTRVLTNISDRLQNRLNVAYDHLNEANEELKTNHEQIEKQNLLLIETNEILQLTVQELTKARISRKAATLVIAIAIALFFVSEVLIEPVIDSYFKQQWGALILKGSIALLLRPLDTLVENYLMRSALRKIKQEKPM